MFNAFLKESCVKATQQVDRRRLCVGDLESHFPGCLLCIDRIFNRLALEMLPLGW
jgi:hypothetical protein